MASLRNVFVAVLCLIVVGGSIYGTCASQMSRGNDTGHYPAQITLWYVTVDAPELPVDYCSTVDFCNAILFAEDGQSGECKPCVSSFQFAQGAAIVSIVLSIIAFIIQLIVCKVDFTLSNDPSAEPLVNEDGQARSGHWASPLTKILFVTASLNAIASVGVASDILHACHTKFCNFAGSFSDLKFLLGSGWYAFLIAGLASLALLLLLWIPLIYRHCCSGRHSAADESQSRPKSTTHAI